MAHFRPESPKFANFESIIHQTGWGIYYKYILGMFSTCSFAHAIGCFSLLLGLPFLTCDSLLTNEVIFTIYCSFILGKSVGGLLLNSVADYYGRKKIMLYSLVISFLAQFTCAFTNSNNILIIAAFAIGSCLESLICPIKVNLSETFATEQRSFCLVILDIFWVFGYFLIIVISMLMTKTQNKEKQRMYLTLESWRVIFALSGGLYLIVACATALIEESPRYLLHNRRNYLALLLIKQYYTINQSLFADKLEITEADLNNLIFEYGLSSYPEPISYCEQIKALLFRICKAVSFVIGKQYWKTTFILIFFNLSIFFGIFNINMILTRKLMESEINPSTSISIKKLHFTKPIDGNCAFSPNYNLYERFFLLIGNILVGKILLLVIIERVGYKIAMSTSFFSASLGFLLLTYEQSKIMKVLIVSLVMVAYSIIESTVNINTIESFPTAVRATSIGVTRLFPGIFLIFFLCSGTTQNMFFWLSSGLMLGASLLSYFIVDLTGKPMVE